MSCLDDAVTSGAASELQVVGLVFVRQIDHEAMPVALANISMRHFDLRFVLSL